MKRGKLVNVHLRGPTQNYGEVWSSSLSAVRETLHEALDVYIDELAKEIDAGMPMQASPLAHVQIEARW